MFKAWHLGIVVAVIVGYVLGVVWPGPGAMVRGKIGV